MQSVTTGVRGARIAAPSTPRAFAPAHHRLQHSELACQCRSSESPQHQNLSNLRCSRRDLALLSIVMLNARASSAAEVLTADAINLYANSGDQQELFIDDEYEYLPPAGFQYIEISMPIKERGPAPERSPLRSRFEAPKSTGTASISVVVRNAQSLTFSLTQVTDISLFGTPEEAAKLLVPKGSRLISATSQVVDLPPRDTPLGPIDIPPKSYYIYEFLTAQGDHIAMSAAAARGKVFVCGGAAPVQQWPNFAKELVATVQSFRLR